MKPFILIVRASSISTLCQEFNKHPSFTNVRTSKTIPSHSYFQGHFIFIAFSKIVVVGTLYLESLKLFYLEIKYISVYNMKK